ncbi:MAG: type II/IV secretion system protein, partial [Planctomycetaceae bacterium]|nr:type II/IV secretion system protein [Planctomycetaceae bacterium]
MADDYLAKLIKDGVISRDQLEEARDLASSLGVSTEDALVRLGYVSAAELTERQASQYGYEFVNLETLEIPRTVIELVPESVARENVVIPLGLDDDVIRVAVSNAMDYEVLDKLRFVLNREIKIAVASKEAIQSAINRHYGDSQTESVDSMLAEFTETA